MWQTSDAFNAALARDRRIATRVEVLWKGQTQTVLDTIVQGTITAENAVVRRSGSIRIVDPSGTLTPVTARDLLAPRGTELRVFKGLYLPGVTDPEMVPLGTLRISEPEVSRDSGGGVVIDVKAYDRARALQRARFRTPWNITAGTLVSEAIRSIVTTQSNFPVNITPTTAVTPVLVFEHLSDPWDAINQLTDSVGYEAFFDVLGTFVARPTPDYEALTPAWAYQTGELSLLVDNTRKMTDEDAYSGVVVTAEHPDNANPIRVEVWDTDPSSPTYYDPANPSVSEFGPVPYGFASPIITTTDQATLAGQTILNRVSGLREKVTVETLGHFGHDVGDVISAIDPGTRLDGTHVIEQVVQPIRRGTMTLTMRARRAIQV